ncbi:MAG: hypothetical protein AAB250_14475 [Bdellovibrionota bacterium]
MDNNTAKNFVSVSNEHENVLDDENNCCLCGSQLDFKHNVDYLTLKIKEDAHCPSCQIQMKSREHTLQ